jgi:transposase
MEYGAIDLHARESVIRIVDETGAILLDRRIATRHDRFADVVGDRPRMRIIVESSTESEWVAQGLEALGHEVVVADPNYALMYGHRSRRVKTDRRDVAALAEACRLGIYRAAHRVSAVQQQARQQLRVRSQLVRVRTQTINLARAILRTHGLRLPSGSAETVAARMEALTVPAPVRVILQPLIDLLRYLDTPVKTADAWVRATAAADPVTRRLMTAPGVGPVTAVTFRATIDRVDRFTHAGQVSAYMGLVPREDSSAERQRKGHITKAGPGDLRALLISAAWVIWRRPGTGGAALHAWVTRVAAKRGRRIAVVGLARRLSRILFAMWRDETDFTIERRQRTPVAA